MYEISATGFEHSDAEPRVWVQSATSIKQARGIVSGWRKEPPDPQCLIEIWRGKYNVGAAVYSSEIRQREDAAVA